MTDQPNPDPSAEELQQLDVAIREMLAAFFERAGVTPDYGVMLLANATGQAVRAFASPECVEQSLATIFSIIRQRAEGLTLDAPVLQ